MVVRNIGKILLISSLIIEIHCTELHYKTFSCKSGEFIANQHFCDGLAQCSDQSDEPPSCNFNKEKCGESGMYFCPNGTCEYMDRISDLSENLEEYKNSENNSRSNSATKSTSTQNTTFKCDDKRCVIYMNEDVCNCFRNCSTNLSNGSKSNNSSILKNSCLSYEEKFACVDGKRCLHLEYVCDGNCNCLDCSDEHNCSKVGNKKVADCPYSYFPTPSGPVCLSNESHSSVSNCLSDDICDQNCTRYNTRAICSCYKGYNTAANREYSFKCQSNESLQDIIIYSTSSQLKSLNLTSMKLDVILQNLPQHAVFTATDDYLYYVSHSNHREIVVKKYSFLFKNATTIESAKSNSPIISMAVDYITENLYFTTNKTLSICNTVNINQTCAQLPYDDVNYVALAPQYGWMFYTKKAVYFDDERFIMKSDMDGSNEVIFIDGTFRSPTSLVTDESIRRLYWFNSEQERLFSIPFNGDTNEIRMFQNLGKIVSITALDSRVFFSKPEDNEIFILENRQNFTKSIKKNKKETVYQSRFDVSGYLRRTSLNFDEHLTEGNLVEVQHLYAYTRNFTRIGNLKKNNPCENSQFSCAGLCLLQPKNRANCVCRPNGTDISSESIRCNNSTEKTISNTTTTTPDTSTTLKMNVITPSNTMAIISPTAGNESAKPNLHLEPVTQSSNNPTVSYTMVTISPNGTNESTKLNLQNSEPEARSFISFQFVFIMILLIVTVCGLYFFNKRRNQYTNFNPRRWIRTNYYNRPNSEYDQENL